jgi:hypothetical protein
LCTISDQPFFIADLVTSDNWNLNYNSYAGTIGFGNNSPVWGMLGLGSTNTKTFEVYLTNFIDWTWFDESYEVYSDQSYINLIKLSI